MALFETLLDSEDVCAPAPKPFNDDNIPKHITLDQQAAIDVPLDTSMVMVGPYGSGKTWVSLIQATRFIEDCEKTGSKGLVTLVSQATSEKLLNSFQLFARKHETRNVSIHVATVGQLTKDWNLPVIKTSDGGVDRLKWWNQLARELRRRHEEDIKLLLLADEVYPAAVYHSTDETLDSCNWSRMDMGTVRLVMCIRPIVASSWHVEFTWPDSVTVCRLYHCFRQATQIYECLHFMKKQIPAGVIWARSLCPLDQIKIGTSRSGTVPVWYHLPDKITCRAGRAQLKKVLDKIHAEVEDCGVAAAQVPVIVNGHSSEYKELTETVRSVSGSIFSQVRERSEMVGCESDTVICVTPIHGNSWQDHFTRAVSRLYIVTHNTGDWPESRARQQGVDLETLLAKTVAAGLLEERTVDRKRSKCDIM